MNGQTEQMLDEMCATLGGRAAEKIIFDKISTGALSDLEKVTKQARAMVTVYGLSDKIGNLTYYDSSGNDSGFNKPYSEETAKTIDEEISKIIEGQYIRAIDILDKNRDKLDILAQKLLEDITHHFWITFTLGSLHSLPNKETKKTLVASFILSSVIRVISKNLLANRFKRASITHLL